MTTSRRFRAGTVHFIDFDDFAPQGSEMVKGRGVVIVSPSRRRNSDLVIVVPLSKKPPVTHKKHTVRIMHEELSNKDGGSWAKCDMPVTVSTSRLRDYRRPKYEGQNHIPVVHISGEELRRVREAMIRAIGAKEVLDRLRKEFNDAFNASQHPPKQKPKTTRTKITRPVKPPSSRKNRPIRAMKAG